MSSVLYDLEVIRQEDNRICWVASCAMVKSWGTQSSIGVGEFTGGFDPSTSCIANLARDWEQCVELMNKWGFDVLSIGDVTSGNISADELVTLISGRGPAVLLHLCEGFPYGNQWAPMNEGAHAVVITGIDTDTAQLFFNNPWGDKDQSADLSIMINKINLDQVQGKTLGFWRG